MSISRMVLVGLCLQALTPAVDAQSQAQFTLGGGMMTFGEFADAAPHLFASAEHVGSGGFGIGGDAALMFDRTEAFPPYRASEPFRQFVGSAFVSAHPRVARPGRRLRIEPLLGAGISLVTVPGCCGSALMWNASAGVAT